jgi:hypothetical protein
MSARHRRDHSKPERAKAKEAIRRLDYALDLVQKVYEDVRDNVLDPDPPDVRHIIDVIARIVTIAENMNNKLGGTGESEK